MQEIPFVTAAIEAGTSFGILDEFELARLDLQGVHILLRVDLSGIEQELVRRNGEQRLCELTNGRNQKVLDILTCQNDRGVLFAHTLHAVTQIFDCSHIREEEVQLIHRCRRAAFAEQFVAHIGQDIEQHTVLESAVGIHKPFHTEYKEVGVGDVGVAVEVFAFRADTHGMDAETDFL